MIHVKYYATKAHECFLIDNESSSIRCFVRDCEDGYCSEMYVVRGKIPLLRHSDAFADFCLCVLNEGVKSKVSVTIMELISNTW